MTGHSPRAWRKGQIDPNRTLGSRWDDCGSHFRGPSQSDPKTTKRLQRARAADIPCAMLATNNSLAAARAQSACRRRPWRIDATVALTLAALGLRPATPAHAQSPLLQGWLASNAMCKGDRSDDPKTLRSCENRDRLSMKLKRLALARRGRPQGQARLETVSLRLRTGLQIDQRKQPRKIVWRRRDATRKSGGQYRDLQCPAHQRRYCRP